MSEPVIVPSDDGKTNTTFIDLGPDDYPFWLNFISERTGQVVWEQYVDAPGAVQVPALGSLYGPVKARLTFADGEVWNSDDPDPET